MEASKLQEKLNRALSEEGIRVEHISTTEFSNGYVSYTISTQIQVEGQDDTFKGPGAEIAVNTEIFTDNDWAANIFSTVKKLKTKTKKYREPLEQLYKN